MNFELTSQLIEGNINADIINKNINSNKMYYNISEHCGNE